MVEISDELWEEVTDVVFKTSILAEPSRELQKKLLMLELTEKK